MLNGVQLHARNKCGKYYSDGASMSMCFQGLHDGIEITGHVFMFSNADVSGSP